MSRLAVVALLGLALFAGCLDDDEPKAADPDPAGTSLTPFASYAVRKPDIEMALRMDEALVPAGDVEVHVRIVRPASEAEKVPVIVEFTPYTAGVGSVGVNPVLDGAIEPIAGCAAVAAPCDSTFDTQFVRRGYAFAYADVRGTGDSSGCLDLRGKRDVADAAAVIEWLGTQPWSNGKVGFIGASYPGSEAHIAAIAEAGAKTGHLGGVIPVVASTSFYSYHHYGGVPYNPNHALGGTNTGYTSNAVAPTINVQDPNYLTKWIDEATCPVDENVVSYGGLDQTGTYDTWWADRNLRGEAGKVTVPVLMAQGLADWNVKPDHVARYFNDLTVQKTFIGGQWGHQYPRSKGDCAAYDPSAACDPNIPWGVWWEYATAFFDTTLKGIDTGMFQDDVAWVQDNAGDWHRSSEWPLQTGAASQTLYFQQGGAIQPERIVIEPTQLEWAACPKDKVNRGLPVAPIEESLAQCTASDLAPESLVFTTRPFTQTTIISGVPRVNLTLTSTADFTHVLVIVDRLDSGGNVVQARENYGYLNPTYRFGVEQPEPVPVGQPYQVSIPLFPQEDVVKAGESLRVTIQSNDGGRTIEAYDEGINAIQFGPASDNSLWLPIRPESLQGVRLA